MRHAEGYAHKIFFHIGWSTHRRLPMIDQAAAHFLDGYFRRVAIREGAEVVALGILRDHVHLLVRTAARFDVPHMVQAMKGGSSYEVNHLPRLKPGPKLRWNHRYIISTVSPRALGIVVGYIARQAETGLQPHAVGAPASSRVRQGAPIS